MPCKSYTASSPTPLLSPYPLYPSETTFCPLYYRLFSAKSVKTHAFHSSFTTLQLDSGRIAEWSTKLRTKERVEMTSRKQGIDFDVCKRNLLLKLSKELDKSKKGSVDAPIVDFVEYVNKTPDFCTTSSCSGRFSIFCASYDEEKSAQVSVRIRRAASSVEGREVALRGASRGYPGGADCQDEGGAASLQGRHAL